MAIKHTAFAVTPDDGVSEVGSSEWNAYHTVDANGLSIPVYSSIPTTPAAGNFVISGKLHAGIEQPIWENSNGEIKLIAESLEESNQVILIPSGITPISYGTQWVPLSNGAGSGLSYPSRSVTNFSTRQPKITLSTGATATGWCILASSVANTFWRGNAAGLGGFYASFIFEVSALASDMRCLFSLEAESVNVATSSAEPSTSNNSIGIIKDTGDTNWQFFTRDATTTVKNDLGVEITAGKFLKAICAAKPNDTNIYFQLIDHETKAILVNTTAFSTNLPANTVFMRPRIGVFSATGTTAKAISVSKFYGVVR